MDIDRILRQQIGSQATGSGGISRRDLLKRGGLLAGAAMGMPAILAAFLITSMLTRRIPSMAKPRSASRTGSRCVGGVAFSGESEAIS